MTSLFSSGFLTLNGSSLTMVFSITSILAQILIAAVSPKEFMFFIPFSLIDILIIFAVVRRKKIILSICFWINSILFAVLTLFFIILIGALFNLPVDEITEVLKKKVQIEDGVIAALILASIQCTFTWIMIVWTCYYCYLCALKAARKECGEVYQVYVAKQLEQSV
ncbi:hypothetical protein PRIPAC_88790 [Pristionchus pacificus]|uniref:Uncharacterized protein n=1 Tax=Pristionchus pacificus TaxID=54126 RepID=A0A2A6B6D9_PRIPA|nr:hypothetical protein PRIPAC_88790 [Pristionchus pacificus]|eukprot:PDM61450.1 hypothetical protein PRIPAC_50892 [Pristionchus pacificus]